MKLAIHCQSTELRDQAQNLGLKFGIPFDQSGHLNADFVLTLTESGIELVDKKHPELSGLSISPNEGRLGYRLKQNDFDLLLRAMGTPGEVIDGTAGLGRDAFVLSHKGYRVSAIEQNPALALMLEYVQRHLPTENQFVAVTCADIHQIVTDMPIGERLYLDPMFKPPNRKSLPKKDIQILERLVADDPQTDFSEVLKLARTRFHRIVVKRHIKQEPLAKDVSISFKGIAIRFDVYLKA
ncbi:MAG: class I SAM-dependent methyltransferase [Oligoflexia bacterium]|nr:class I SAM-dependent methyltransferase [Oligoflexia bacterium]